jgi:hypothetical protein
LEAFLYIGLLALIMIGIPIGIGLLLYYIPKKIGYPKVGKYLTGLFALAVLVLVFMTIFEDQLFTKNDARKLIEEQELKLTEEFKLENNKSMWAIGYYYHTFTLTISEKDKLNAIKIIKSSDNFKEIGKPTKDLLLDIEDRYNGPKQTQNYETENAFIREYIKPNGQGYAPTFRRIIVNKQKNEMTFEEINP